MDPTLAVGEEPTRNEEPKTADSLDVQVSLDVSSKVAEFALSQTAEFSKTNWTELTSNRVRFQLAAAGPVPGPRFVYCKYRNNSGAGSYTCSASMVYDPRSDADRDGIINERDPDDDQDGIPDGDEMRKGTNPTSSGTNGDSSS